MANVHQYHVISNAALRAREENRTITCKDLSTALNALGLLTDKGEKYKGKRGTYTLVDRADSFFRYEQDSLDIAEAIAKTYTNEKGELAWIGKEED